MNKCFTFNNVADKSQPVEVLIYDRIGRDMWTGDGVVAKEFAQELSKVPQGRKITVAINSPGGSVHDGLAIHNLLSARRNDVTCRIDGIAASIASVIALAGHKLEMPASALMMIHDPSGMCMGTADDMIEMAAALEKHKGVLVNVYEEKTKKPRTEIEQAMKDETWFTAADAKAWGFVDVVTAEVAATNSFDLSQFRRVPESLKNQTKPPAPDNGGGAKPNSMKNKLIALLTERGITFENTATEEQLLDLLANHKPAAQAAPAAPAADPATVADVKAIKAQLAAERKTRITAAVQACADAGRIPGNSVAEWVNDIVAAADEEAGAKILARLQALPERKPGHDPVSGAASEPVKAIKRSEFEAMSHGDRNEFIRGGGKIKE